MNQYAKPEVFEGYHYISQVADDSATVQEAYRVANMQALELRDVESQVDSGEDEGTVVL